jgi:hypothetical protein
MPRKIQTPPPRAHLRWNGSAAAAASGTEARPTSFEERITSLAPLRRLTRSSSWLIGWWLRWRVAVGGEDKVAVGRQSGMRRPPSPCHLDVEHLNIIDGHPQQLAGRLL